MKNIKNKILSGVLAVIMLLSMLPITAMAAPASDLPDNMIDSYILRALAYTGYDVEAQKANGTLYQKNSISSKTPASILSDISYGTSTSGFETVANSSTKTGFAPNIAKFEQSGLCCAAFVTYYICNYLPNIEGINTQFITNEIKATGMNSQSVATWERALGQLASRGELEKIGTNSSNVDRSKLCPGDIILFGNSTDSSVHAAIFAGTYKDEDYIIHVGNEQGPEISIARYMAQSGSKSSTPNAYYHLPQDLFEQNGKIEINKKDTDGNKLAGACFTATSVTDSSRTYKIGPTNSNGYAFIEGIPFDTYKIVETVFPTNYRSYGQREWTVTLNKNTVNSTVTVNAVNELIPGNIKIVKTSEDGKIDGITFTIKGNGIDKTVKTDSSGEIKSDDLKPGTYTVTEQVYDKYEPQESRNVTVISGQTSTVTFNNVLKRGELKVMKESEDGLTEGITFKLSGVSLSGHTVEQYAVTDAEGIAIFEDVLITGHSAYVLEEVDTAEKYIVPEKQTVVIEWNKVTEKSVYNKLKRGDLKVIKTSEDNLVQGIRFRLYGTSLSGASVNEYATVGIDGTALFEDILIGGNYTVEEVNTAVKYVIPKPQGAVIEWNRVTEKSFQNILKKFRIDAFKIDAELAENNSGNMPASYTLPSDGIAEMYGYPYGETQGDAVLEGAVYGLYQNGTLIDIYTTDRNGYFITDYYICGEGYYIQEISPSEGYLLDSAKYYINCTADRYTVELNTEYLDVTEEIIKGRIGLVKHTDDGDTRIETPETGAVFEVYLKSSGSYKNAKGTERDKLVIDEDGFALSKELPYGVYTVHQTKGWEGRERLPDFDVAITKDGFVYRYIINNANFKSYIKITKTDSTTGKVIPYAGAGFKLYAPDGTQIKMQYTYPAVTVIDTFYTTADGTLVTPETLPYGKGYSLVEVQANYGYVLDSTPVYFDIMQENSTAESDITIVNVTKGNQPQMGTITITKSGEVFSSVAEKDGVYQPVYKVTGLEGAVFSVYADENIYTLDGTLRCEKGQKVDTVTTGQDGKATTKALYLGKYVIKEDKAPYGMVLNSEPVFAELTYAGQDISVTAVAVSMTNKRQKIALDLLKAMEQDETFQLGMNGEISKVSFGLYAAETLTAADGTEIPKDGLIEAVQCSADGKAVFTTDVPVGAKLYVKEIATDHSYILSDTVYFVAFVYAGQDAATIIITVNDGNAIENKIARGSVEGLKSDEDGNTVEGVVFGLFRADTTDFSKENAILISTTDSEGKFGFENLPVQKWLIKELSCPEQYVLSDEVFTVEITEDGQVVDIEAENKFVTGNIEVTKTDSDTAEKLSGAVFEVYRDIDGDQVFNAEIDTLYGILSETETGVYLLEGLRYAGYFLHESESPANHLPGDEYYYFAVTENGKTVTVETAEGKGFENEAFKGSIKIIKKDADTGERLSNVEFGLFDLEGNEIARGTTDENGEILFEDIRYGKYQIRELKAQKGYQKNEEIIEVDITEDGQTCTVELINKKIPVRPQIPQTGDNRNVGLWFAVICLSLFVLAGLGTYNRRIQNY